MKKYWTLSIVFTALATLTPLAAQEPVVGVAEPEALFRSTDPKLNANKQVVYGIFRDLLEANHWELANKYLTQRYLQHNPNAASGLPGVVTFFTQVMKVKPQPIQPKLKSKIVSVMAEGDLVIVAWPRQYKNPKDPSKTYTTTWFDMWRIKEGKADEHWDCAMKDWHTSPVRVYGPARIFLPILPANVMTCPSTDVEVRDLFHGTSPSYDFGIQG